MKRKTFSATVVSVLALAISFALGKPPEGIKTQPSLGPAAQNTATTPPPAKPQLPEGPKPIPASEVKGPHPVITPDETTHDFGPSWMGPPLKHSFKIKNTGDAVLEVTKVHPSCGCTIAGEYPHKLDPGQEGEFPFSLMSNKLHGAFEKSITVTSNDPVTPEVRLKLRGEVKRYVDVTPQAANFGKVLTTEPETRDLIVTNNTDKNLELKLGESSDKRFKFEIIPKTPGKEFTIRVTLTPTSDPGNLRAQVNLTTNIDDQKDVQVDATATIPPRLEIQPQSIALLKPAPGVVADQGTSRVVRFTNYGKKPVKVTEATCDDPTVKVTVNERKAGEQYNINVELPANYEPPTEGRMVTLNTDDSEMPTFKIPITSAGQAIPKTVEAPKPVEANSFVGKSVPTFAPTTTIDGKPFSIDTMKDHVTVVDFFAPNCGFCKKQIPRMEAIRSPFADKGVRFVNVSQKMGEKEFSKDEVLEILKGLGFHGEVVLDHENKIGPLFGANSFPTMVVVGKSGKVEAVNVGNAADLETKLTGQLEALLAGKPVPGETAAKPTTAPSAPPAAPTAPAAAPGQAQAPPPAPPAAQPPAAQPPAAGGIVGKPAAPFNLKTGGGKPLSNAELANSPATVFDFFAVNCGFCGKQIPRLETIRQEFENKGVRFVAVQCKMGKEFSEDEAKDKLKELGWHGELARDMDNKVGPLMGLNGFPTMAVVSKSGRLEAINVGNIPDLETKVKGQLEALVAGKPIPPEFASAPQMPSAPSGPDALAGKLAPSFELAMADGKKVTNADVNSSSATVLNFFAVNCPHCQMQIPKLESIRKAYAAKGVRFINVQETMGPKPPTDEELAKKMSDLGWGGELAKDPQNLIGPKFNANGFPTMIVLGKSGKVEASNVGDAPDIESKLKDQLDAIIAGKPAPTGGSPSSEAPAQPPQRPANALAGQPAPQFAVDTLDGKKVSNVDFGQHPATVLNFVAPNCGFCKKQLPTVETIRKDYEAKGVRFVNIYQQMGEKAFTVEEATKVFKDVGSQLELARDEGNKVGQTFKAVSYPTMMVVNKQGTIEYVNIGAKPDMDTRLRGQLDSMMSGKKWADPDAAGGAVQK
ncbi:MAG: redoxin domain-containing protein [Planctomycetes bacterium]|nr:redoxin domain-containing protein [Planctomycetota bacterium]MBI3834704.1 redoxin domain-containing protein [Planctomycetota bacterium]